MFRLLRTTVEMLPAIGTELVINWKTFKYKKI